MVEQVLETDMQRRARLSADERKKDELEKRKRERSAKSRFYTVMNATSDKHISRDGNVMDAVLQMCFQSQVCSSVSSFWV